MPTTYTKLATERKGSANVAAGKGDAHSPKVLLCSTVELASATAGGSTVKMGKIPTNARILGASRIYWDDLTTANSPTLDIGLGAVNSNVTDDADALNDGLDISSASTANVGAIVIKDRVNYGKMAWEFVSGVTTDPGGELEVYVSALDAAHTTTGTITIELIGYFD